MLVVELVTFFFLGLFTGCIAGLFGVSGGFILVPAQVFLFQLFQIPPHLQVKLAIGSSLGSAVFTSLMAMHSHNKHKTILWDLVLKIAPGLILGAITGASAGIFMPAKVLEVLFGVIACSTGVYFLLPYSVLKEEPLALPSLKLIITVGFFIGFTSSMVGLGGGLIFLPVAILVFGAPILQAIGTSSIATCLIAFFGALTFLIPTVSEPIYPHAIGYLYLPSFIPITLGSLTTVGLGVKWARTLHKTTLKRVFALLIISVGILMIAR